MRPRYIMVCTMAKRPETVWAKRLKRLREKHGMTQAEASAKAGVALRTWIGWENSFRTPRGASVSLLRLVFPDIEKI